MIQVAACGHCGRMRPVHELRPVEVYTFEHSEGFTRPASRFVGLQMFCRRCFARVAEGEEEGTAP